MPFNNYPYTNMNDLNLDFLLKNQDQIMSWIRDNIGEIVLDALYDPVEEKIILKAPTGTVLNDGEVKAFQIENVLHGVKDNVLRAIVTGLSNDVSTNSKSIDILKHGKNIVFFGDSWIVGSKVPVADRPTKAFYALLSAKLGKTPFNFGVGGAGYMVTGNTISTQITMASGSMTDTQKEETGFVVFLAGVNDWRHKDDYSITLSNWQDQIATDLASAHTLFPNATIVLCLSNSEQYSFSDTWAHWITSAQNYIARTVNTFPIIIVQNVAEALNFQDDLYDSDELHPNEKGHATLAGHVMRGIMGGGCEVKYYWGQPTFSTGVSTSPVIHMFRDGDLMQITETNWSFSSNLAAGASVTLATIPEGIAPKQNVYYPLYRGNKVVGTIAITGGGPHSIVATNQSDSAISGGYSGFMQFRLDRS